jgi:hypothetical protein
MASNAASSVQFRVNGTEMARGRTRKTERSQSMDPRAKPRAAGRLKGKRRDNRDEREFILGPENAGNFCIARDTTGTSGSAICRSWSSRERWKLGGSCENGRRGSYARPASVEVNCDQLGCCHLFRKPSNCNHSANRSIQ